MSERWDWDGPPHNIHVFEADQPHMRVCFLTSDGQTEARARLIAAAPDLLEALKAAVRIAGLARMEWDAAPNGARAGKLLIALEGGCKGYRADIDAIHAAIAKAEGR